MRSKGFTLIELLAVIVILAIIALIAVPIVINIIEDSKNSSDEQTVELYLDTARKSIIKKQLSNSNFNPDKCIIQLDGNLKCFNGTTSLGIIEIDIKGKIPEKGTIELQNNKYIYKNIWFNNKKYYSISTLIDDADNDGEISIGDKYLYKVNKENEFYFYVLSINLDNTVNLIMNSNICNNGNESKKGYECKYPWHTNEINNNAGPDTAMINLYNATKNWNNVPDMIMNYIDEKNINDNTKGYIGVTTDKYNKVTTIVAKNGKENTLIGSKEYPLKARLPKLNEINCSSYGSCPFWLVENLKYYNTTENTGSDDYLKNKDLLLSTEGYWILAASSNRVHALIIRYNGSLANEQTNYISIGIRPVITVPISDLS